MRSKSRILALISQYRSDIESYSTHKSIVTKRRNEIRLLQWVLGCRKRPYAEGSPLMEKEDAIALRKEKELRKKVYKK